MTNWFRVAAMVLEGVDPARVHPSTIADLWVAAIRLTTSDKATEFERWVGADFVGRVIQEVDEHARSSWTMGERESGGTGATSTDGRG